MSCFQSHHFSRVIWVPNKIKFLELSTRILQTIHSPLTVIDSLASPSRRQIEYSWINYARNYPERSFFFIKLCPLMEIAHIQKFTNKKARKTRSANKKKRQFVIESSWNRNKQQAESIINSMSFGARSVVVQLTFCLPLKMYAIMY